jgi:hypothetical protein
LVTIASLRSWVAAGWKLFTRPKTPDCVRIIAPKFLPDDLAKAPRVLARFQREARAASALTHPNICTIYDVGEVGGNAFIAMEYLNGTTLQHLLPERSVDLERLIDVSIDLATGLESAARGSKSVQLGLEHTANESAKGWVAPDFLLERWRKRRAAENARKTYDLREKVSDRERFWIEGYYYLLGNWRLGEGRAVFRVVETDLPEGFRTSQWVGACFLPLKKMCGCDRIAWTIPR